MADTSVPNDMKTHEVYTWNVAIPAPSYYPEPVCFGNLPRIPHRAHLECHRAKSSAVPRTWSLHAPHGDRAGFLSGLFDGAERQPAGRLLDLANPQANLGYMTQYDDGGTQGYNGMLLDMRWRHGHNLNLLGQLHLVTLHRSFDNHPSESWRELHPPGLPECGFSRSQPGRRQLHFRPKAPLQHDIRSEDAAVCKQHTEVSGVRLVVLHHLRGRGPEPL